MAETVLQVLDAAAEKWGAKPAMKAKRGGRWQVTTWREYRQQARQVARALMALGLEPGGAITIIGFNRPEWFLADIGAIYAGGVAAGIYSTCSPSQCQYITHHCEAVVAVVENAEQLAKFKQVRSELPLLKRIVLMEGRDPDDDVLSWEELLELGETVPEAELDERAAFFFND